MFSQETPDEAAAELLHSYQQTLNNLAQKMLIKDVRIDNFHGRDNEDISRWFEKLELLLTTTGKAKTSPLAVAQIINNLSGPAEREVSKECTSLFSQMVILDPTCILPVHDLTSPQARRIALSRTGE